MTARLVSGRAGAEEIMSLVTASTSYLRADRPRQAEHHDVVGRHQRGERRSAFGQRLDAVLGVEALARIDRCDAAAIAERAEEVERVRMAHRHDQESAIVPVNPKLDLGDQGQQDTPPWLRMTPFGLPVVPEVYISVHGSAGDLLAGLATAARRDQVLIGAVPGRHGRRPK